MATTYEEKWEVLRESIQKILDKYVDTFSETIRSDGIVKGSTTAYLNVMQLMEVIETGIRDA